MLQRDHHNLLAALRWFVEHREIEPGLRFGGAIGRFWYWVGYFAAGREALRPLLALAGASTSAARAQCLATAAVLALLQGDFAASRALAEERLGLLRRLGDRPAIAAGLNQLAMAVRELGDRGAARALLEESLALYRDLGHRRGIARALFRLGQVAHDDGESSRACSLYAMAWSIAGEIADLEFRAAAAQGLGRLALERGDAEAARARFAESLGIQRERGDLLGLSHALAAFAALAAQRTPRYAVRLAGAANALGLTVGAPAKTTEHDWYAPWLTMAAAALSAADEAAAWAEGQAMPLEAAIAKALETSADAGRDRATTEATEPEDQSSGGVSKRG